MISHRHQCIFIHIPKCAGTSIEHALGYYDEPGGQRWPDHRTIRMIERPYLVPATFRSRDNALELLRRYRHQLLRCTNHYGDRYTVTREQYQSYFKFTVVRNPWARAFSWYMNVLRNERHREKLGVQADISLSCFLQRFAGKGVLRPQLYWIKALDGSVPLDYIGRFENLAEDMDEISERLHLAGVVLPHRVKGPGRDYREYYDETAIRLVAHVYAEEIALFGYSFDLWDRRAYL